MPLWVFLNAWFALSLFIEILCILTLYLCIFVCHSIQSRGCKIKWNPVDRRSIDRLIHWLSDGCCEGDGDDHVDDRSQHPFTPPAADVGAGCHSNASSPGGVVKLCQLATGSLLSRLTGSRADHLRIVALCVSVCSCVHALNWKRLSLSTPNLVRLQTTAAASYAKIMRLKGQRFMKKVKVACC